MRISFVGKKIGSSQIKTEKGVLPVTLVEVFDYDVFGIKTLEKHGYNAVLISAGNVKKESKVAKPLLSQLKKSELQPREKIFEVRIDSQKSIQSAQKTDADIFDILENSFVDVSGVTIGKGFAGPMKRWNFGGLEASHGVSVSHRSHGSTGQRQDPGRVFKGKKMAGHMGVRNRTTQNLKIVFTDKELRVIAIHGAIPGAKGSFVTINDSMKMGRQNLFTTINNNINLVF